MKNLRGQPLWQAITSAQTYWPQVEYALPIGGVVIAGTIDAVLQSSHGGWQQVKFCADKVANEEVKACLAPGKLEMEIGREAARNLLSQRGQTGEIESMLYFLYPAVEEKITLAADSSADLAARLKGLVQKFQGCQAAGQWSACRGDHCTCCPYRPLCREAQK